MRCTGEIKQCLECPLVDCGVEEQEKKDRRDYYKAWYKRNREKHLAKVKSNPRYVEKWGK